MMGLMQSPGCMSRDYGFGNDHGQPLPHLHPFNYMILGGEMHTRQTNGKTAS